MNDHKIIKSDWANEKSNIIEGIKDILEYKTLNIEIEKKNNIFIKKCLKNLFHQLENNKKGLK